MLRTVVHYIMTMKTCHISEVAKEKMTDRQLGDLGKIDCGQPLKIPGGKNMACRQLWGAAQHVSGSKTRLFVTSWSKGEGHDVRGGGQHHPQEELLPLRCHQLSDTSLKSTGQEDFTFCNSRKWRPWGYRKYFADSQHWEGILLHCADWTLPAAWSNRDQLQRIFNRDDFFLRLWFL